MKISKKLLMLVAVLALGLSCNKDKGPSGSSAELKTEDDKAFYTIGVMFGGKLKDLNLSQKETELMIKGLRDAANGSKPLADPAKYQRKVQELFRKRITQATEVNKKKGEDFINKFISAEGAKKTASGLAYKVTQEGSGGFPGPKDTVEVHYHGTLINGTVFDSSKDRGKTISFPLNRVIKGWTEGLQLVKPGGKIKLVIPSALAYGENGAPPKIPGGSTLIFEVELVKVSTYEEPKGKKKTKKTN